MVELASRPGACVAQIARENGINDNVIFKWLRLWQEEGVYHAAFRQQSNRHHHRLCCLSK
ncbi:transposase [Salmonella enterica]